MTRQKINEMARMKMPTGYEGQNIPTDFSMPSCGIEDVDRAVFNLFDKDLDLTVSEKEETRRVPVVFATGERFALVKRRRAIRDKNGTIILPLVSVRRTGINQTKSWGLPGDTGDLVIKTRLSSKDQQFQNIVNKQGIKNQSNVASPTNFVNRSSVYKYSYPGKIASRRPDSLKTSADGVAINNDLGKNIFEIITVPFPLFFKATYEIIFWTQYTLHMNQMLETFMASYHVSDFGFKVTSDKGYWFVAYVENELSADDNFEEFTDEQRMIKYTIRMFAHGWIVAPKSPGLPSPFRRYYSAPQINFSTSQVAGQIVIPGKSGIKVTGGDPSKFILQDVENLDLDGTVIRSDRQYLEYVEDTIRDPFTDKRKTRLLPVLTRNQRQGETVVSARIIDKIDEVTS
tara:strand:- start:3448 stop:4650 length:1203 start_codon:yes stop_codon:yes gene_type:complete